MKILTKKELLEVITQAINKGRCDVKSDYCKALFLTNRAKYKRLHLQLSQLSSNRYLQVINDNIDIIYNTYKDVMRNPKNAIEPHWTHDELGYYDIADINFKENSIERKLRHIVTIKFHFCIDQLVFIYLETKEPPYFIGLNYVCEDWDFDLMHYGFRLLDIKSLKEKYPNFKTLDDLSIKIRNNWNI